MKSKSHLNEPDPEGRKISPVRGPATPRTRLTNRTNPASKRNGTQGASPSPGPATRGSPAPRTASTGPGRTPQTKRRELSLTQAEKNSPTGSPRTRDAAKPAAPRKQAPSRQKPDEANPAESCRKSSNSSQDSGIGRDIRPAGGRQDRTRPAVAKAKNNNPIIRTTSPETVEIEVSNRKKFEELCDVANVELGIVKVPAELLDDLIHQGAIENYYDVEAVPVACGLFATVRKCTNKESGVEYAAKFSSRVRCGVDCTTEVLHEIALLSICAESSKIVHLKDVFQNKHEIVLVLEYAPGGDFQSVLDDDMVPFEQDVEGFIVQLLEALSYIHQRNIAHLDIKPQNIVLMSEFPNCEIKLCDLEVSRVIQDNEHIREIIGTPDYVAPEILGMEPITLAADIWSLGVLAYVLLTGFSPFGGDTDQETLRNITTAPLDFPAELFEGVSDQAKDFIKQCLNRNAKLRPTVNDCLQHPWISQKAEPPSPSPLMLKIPAPDHFVSDTPSSGSRRSCQTCRDKITERKRYLSKSREAIFEKVSNSNLKKSLSKSRERLCDMRLTLSKSRDYLNESKQIASRSQDKFYGFKSLSKSQEVLSQALGGSMKRMVNGAVSDISPAHLPINPRVYLDTPDNCDFVILPGSSVLMSHSDLMSLSVSNSPDSFPVVSLSESGRSTPAHASQLTDPPTRDHNSNATPTPKHGIEPLLEVAEEELEEYDNRDPGQNVVYHRERDSRSMESTASSDSGKTRRKNEGRSTRTAKEEKDNINYETKQSMSRSTSSDGIHNNNINNNNSSSNNINIRKVSRSETAEVAVQVNLSKSVSSPEPVRKEVAPPPSKKLPCLSSANDMLEEGNTRPKPGATISEARLRRGRSNDSIGEESKRYSWREELERFRNTKKPLGVSDLIDTFTNKSNSRKVSADDPSFSNVDALNNKRRGSLQINLNQNELAKLTERAESEKSRIAAKLQRRKSTSAIHPVRCTEVKMPGIQEDALPTKPRDDDPAKDLAIHSEKKDKEKETEGEKESGVAEEGRELPAGGDDPTDSELENDQTQTKGRVYLEKANERKRTWDYFEINHPKAISDKKLEQLKAKYTRRKTETSLQIKTLEAKDSSSNPTKPVKTVPSPGRTLSMPVIKGLDHIKRKNLDLAWDPLTGESVGLETESIDSGKGGEMTREPSVCSTEDVVSKPVTEDYPLPSPAPEVGKNQDRRTSFVSELADSEEIIPREQILECFIDPFTGEFLTTQVSKEKSVDDLNHSSDKKSLKVDVSQGDEGVGSLPDTPTDLGKGRPLTVSAKPVDDTDSLLTEDGRFGSTEELVLRTHSAADSSDSDRLSAISVEETAESRLDCEGNRRRLAAKGPAADKQRTITHAKEWAKANKVCTGSFSRGIERFRSESPVTINKAEPTPTTNSKAESPGVSAKGEVPFKFESPSNLSNNIETLLLSSKDETSIKSQTDT